MAHMPAESHQSTKQEKHIRTRKKTPFQHPLDSRLIKGMSRPLEEGPCNTATNLPPSLRAKLNYMQGGRRKAFKRCSVSITCKIISGKFGAERQQNDNCLTEECCFEQFIKYHGILPPLSRAQRSKGISHWSWASLIAQLVKNPLAIKETPVSFLGWEDPLEKGQATHSSILGLSWWLSQ